MSIRKRASGITLIGFLVMLVVVGFFAYMAMRLIPMYVEYMGVVKSMEEVRSEPGARNKSPAEIRRSLIYRFDTQYVDPAAVPPEAIQITRQGNAARLTVKYERRVPFIHNIELLATFEKSVSLSGEDDE